MLYVWCVCIYQSRPFRETLPWTPAQVDQRWPQTAVGCVAGRSSPALRRQPATGRRCWEQGPSASARCPLAHRALALCTWHRRANQVGPYEQLCFEGDVYPLPSGGLFAVEGSGELRYDWAYGLKLALFADLGMLSPSLMEVQPARDFRGSVGTGFRYDTPIGPLRFDVSFRPLYPEDLGPAVTTRCDGSEYHDPKTNRLSTRRSDMFSNWANWRGTSDRPPLAVVFYLAIGEAIGDSPTIAFP